MGYFCASTLARSAFIMLAVLPWPSISHIFVAVLRLGLRCDLSFSLYFVLQPIHLDCSAYILYTLWVLLLAHYISSTSLFICNTTVFHTFYTELPRRRVILFSHFRCSAYALPHLRCISMGNPPNCIHIYVVC